MIISQSKGTKNEGKLYTDTENTKINAISLDL